MAILRNVLAFLIQFLRLISCEISGDIYDSSITTANTLVVDTNGSKSHSQDNSSTDDEGKAIGIISSEDAVSMVVPYAIVFETSTPAFGDPENYTVDIEGRKYLDISVVSKRFLKVSRALEAKIDGITATGSEDCVLEALKITGKFFVSRNITKCDTLTSLALSGSLICNHDWSWLEDSSRNLTVDYARAKCSDVRVQEELHFQRLSFDVGRRILTKLDIDACPVVCKCLTALTREHRFYRHAIKCEYLNLTDDDFVKMNIPRQTTFLSGGNNLLRSTERVFGHVERLHNITELLFENNELSELPYLADGAFKKLERLVLTRNKIRHLDPDAFETIVSRESSMVELEENDFLCDCDAHFFMKILLRNVSKVKDAIATPLKCRSRPDGPAKLMKLQSEECETVVQAEFNPLPLLLAVLAALNALVIYLLCDLINVHYCHTGADTRDPKIHVIVEKFGPLLSSYFSRDDSKGKEEEEQNAAKTAGRSSLKENVPLILRHHTGSFSDRASFSRRADRALTPMAS